MKMNNKDRNSFVKREITSTLITMMSEVPFDKISISDLVARAQVGRASFYRNFIDKQDVLQQESNRLMAEWGGKFKFDEVDKSSSTLISFLDFLKKHQKFYTTLFFTGHDDILQKAILQQFSIPEDSPNIIAYLASSVGYMTYGWVYEWIKRGMQESGTELARMFEKAQGNQ
mgnify:FL=1